MISPTALKPHLVSTRAEAFAAANASARVLTKCGFKAVGEVIDPEDGLVWAMREATGLTP